MLLDVRAAGEAANGHIRGAVNIPDSGIQSALPSFPNKDLKPPVVVYDSRGEGVAERVAMQLIRAGYPGPRVLAGGFAAWQKGGFASQAGVPAATVAYVPKPKTGSISISEFETFRGGIPATVMVIDVRNGEEVEKSGMLKGAVNIPADQIATRLAEIPRDKELVLHCSTGARAEMAYTILKERGYKVRFLDATLTNDDDGGFSIKSN